MNKRISWNEGEHDRYEYNAYPSIFEDLYYRTSVKLESNPLFQIKIWALYVKNIVWNSFGFSVLYSFWNIDIHYIDPVNIGLPSAKLRKFKEVFS